MKIFTKSKNCPLFLDEFGLKQISTILVEKDETVNEYYIQMTDCYL